MKLRITKGSGWYSGEVGEVFEVTGRDDKYNAYYVKVWSDEWDQWESDTHWVRDGNYEIIEDESEDYLKSMSHEELIEEISLLRESERGLMEMLAKIQALLNGEESE